MLSSVAQVLNNRLAGLIYFITARCNARCLHCFNYKNLNTELDRELSASETAQICRKLKKLLVLQCSGGEPFLKDDHFDILNNFASITKAIAITTNGSLSRRIEDTMAKLTKQHTNTLFRVSLSIDAIGSLHDEIRNVAGAFDLVNETFQRLRKIRERNRNLLLSVTTTFSRMNEESIAEIIDYVHALGVNHHVLTYIWGEPRENETCNPSLDLYKKALRYRYSKQYGPKKSGLSPILTEMLNKVTDMTLVDILEKGEMVYPCKAIRKFAILRQNGDVNACHMIDENLGNVRENDYDIQSILRNKRSRELMKKIRDSRCVCKVTCINRHNALYSMRTGYYLVKYLRSNLTMPADSVRCPDSNKPEGSRREGT